MKPIAVVVDSTAVIKKDIVDKYDNLYTVPLKLLVGHESFDDGISLTQEEFFEKMAASQEVPSTSQPSVGEVHDLLEDLLKKYEHIVYITLSSKISGTYQTGCMLRDQLSADRIHVFDSLSTSVIQKEMVLRVMKMIEEGRGVEVIMDCLHEIRENASIVLVVGELHHLQRTGRLSATAASIGTMLQIKPILEFKDGEIVVKKKIRTHKKALKNILDVVAKEELCEEASLMLAHAGGYDRALSVREDIKSIYPFLKIDIDELSPVISMHTGPDTVGVAWIKK